MKFSLRDLLFLFAGALLAAPAHAQCAGDNSFADFFKDFQNAVKTDKPQEVARLTRFPFKARSVLNDDPPMPVSKKLFVQYYKYLMKLDAWDPTGQFVVSNLRGLILSLDPQSDSRIKQYCSLKQGAWVIYPGVVVGVGALRFERAKNGSWFLTGGLLGDLFAHIADRTEPVE